MLCVCASANRRATDNSWIPNRTSCTLTQEEYEAAFNKGRAVAAEHFAEIERAICKGKRLALEQVLDWLKVFLRTAKGDIGRGVPVKEVLDTTLNSMESMKDVYAEKLAENVRLISREIAERHGGACNLTERRA